MIIGMNDVELAVWLSKLRQGLPAEAYDCIYAMAARELPEDRWEGINHMLNNKVSTIG